MLRIKTRFWQTAAALALFSGMLVPLSSAQAKPVPGQTAAGSAGTNAAESGTAEGSSAPLDPKAAAAVQKAETFLNGVGTLRARFSQLAPNGDVSEGTVLLARPGRMRLDYDPPAQVQIVATGNLLIYYDRQLGQPSYMDLDSSPAGVLTRPQIRLNSGELHVLAVSEKQGLTEITVHHPDNPAEGKITLIFSSAPFELRQWRVRDAQGQTTSVSLYNVQYGVPADKSLFAIDDPNFTQPMDRILGRKTGP